MMRWMFGELEGGKGEDQQNFEIKPKAKSGHSGEFRTGNEELGNQN